MKPAILCNMLLKRTCDDYGQVSIRKKHLIERRFLQKVETDYLKNFATIILFENLLMLAGRFVPEERFAHHADILTDYLNKNIDVDLFVSWDFVVYKLKKRLYGLKKSPRLCYENLESLL